MTDEKWIEHEPVLLAETIALLDPRSNNLYLDGTLGGGGHAEAILEASSPAGRLIGLDRDPRAIRHARVRLERFGNRVELHERSFAEIAEISELDSAGLNGALLDLGVSSAQIDEKARGFSYQQDAPLDMRMGPRGEPARDLLARADIDELTGIIRLYGEERHARRVALAIVRERDRHPIDTTGRLREIVERAVPRAEHPLKSVARVFQALRIAVNDELETLSSGLPQIFERLVEGARLVVISYHSLEDRIVKKYFRGLASDCVCPPDFPVCRCDKRSEAIILTARPVTPAEAESGRNPRARSARLRAVERRTAA
ncbi:MAG TPA: 16S rRNA (cytosine(1402)-N(4))-methyltransferase RsmH [Gemmatimonadota bacterium]